MKVQWVLFTSPLVSFLMTLALLFLLSSTTILSWFGLLVFSALANFVSQSFAYVLHVCWSVAFQLLFCTIFTFVMGPVATLCTLYTCFYILVTTLAYLFYLFFLFSSQIFPSNSLSYACYPCIFVLIQFFSTSFLMQCFIYDRLNTYICIVRIFVLLYMWCLNNDIKCFFLCQFTLLCF